MSNSEHLEILRQGVSFWNLWRLQEKPLLFRLPSSIYGQGPDLSGADLRHAALTGIDLSAANLQGADLSQAVLQEADLTLADLRGASLQGANLCRARLAADLRGTDLRQAGLAGADLRGSRIDEHTRLEGVLLQDAEHGSALVSGLPWSLVRLAAIDWEQVSMLGDEELLSLPRLRRAESAPINDQLEHEELMWMYESAIRAYESLGRALQEQGLPAEAARFQARARLLKRNPAYQALQRQRKRRRHRASTALEAVRARVRWGSLLLGPALASWGLALALLQRWPGPGLLLLLLGHAIFGGCLFLRLAETKPGIPRGLVLAQSLAVTGLAASMVLFGLNSALLLLQRVGTVPAIFLSLAGTAFYLASIFTLRDAQGRFFGQRASAGLPPFCLLLVSGLAWLTGPPSGRFAQLFEALTLLVLSVAPFLAERL